MAPWVVIRISFSLIGDSGLGFSTFWYLSMAAIWEYRETERERE
uniref:Uncharacterized protein n=1 Tax=Lotus japonicus TaxID=34305 RepID=I3T131_LOTJA|nr:unknown [Lotus japonicus]